MLFALLLYLIFSSLKNNKSRAMQWKPDGSWLITCTDNMQEKQFNASLQSGSVVTSFFSLLKFKLDNKKILNVLIFKDNVDAEKFRQLRVRLKVEGIGAVESK